MSEKPVLHPWVDTNYSVNQLKDAAMGLREHLTGIVKKDGTDTEHEAALKTAVTALCIAADHIERLEGTVGPLIKQISAVEFSDGSQGLYGVCSAGKLWAYDDNGAPAGWCLKPSGLHKPPLDSLKAVTDNKTYILNNERKKTDL